MRLLKWLLFVLVAGMLGIGGVVVVRTLSLESRQVAVEPYAPLVLDEAALAQRLGKAIQFRTISNSDTSKVDPETFRAFHAYLDTAFPEVHARCQREMVNGLSLLYEWPGTDPALPPFVVLAHQDVVPIATPQAWAHPPFAGEIADGFVWGRGTLDDKGYLLGVLEAAEALMASGFEPKRTVYFAFGHDEEVGGWEGAAKIVETLRARGVTPAFSLDEGMVVLDVDFMPGMDKPIALVALSEKGYLSLEMVAEAPGGHSSTPPPQTAVGILAQAITRVEGNPYPADLDGPMGEMFAALCPEMSLPLRAVFANLWLFAPLVKSQLEAKPPTSAALRTTTAATMISGGTKENVLPTSARAVVNFRLMPGDTVEGVLARTKRLVDDPRVSIKPLGHPNEASPVASTDTPGYAQLVRTIRQVFPEAVVAPSIMLGGSDSHHYDGLVGNTYRFAPFWMTEEDMERIHGANERISVSDYHRVVQFFAQFFRNAAG